MYVHLTTHSAFSLQEGLMTPTDLVQAAKACGMSALGLTDHHLLTGMVEFVKACKDAGIQPVIGLEIDLEQGASGSSRRARTLLSRQRLDQPSTLIASN